MPYSLGQLISFCIKLFINNYQRVKNQIAYHYADRRTGTVKLKLVMHSYRTQPKS